MTSYLAQFVIQHNFSTMSVQFGTIYYIAQLVILVCYFNTICYFSTSQNNLLFRTICTIQHNLLWQHNFLAQFGPICCLPQFVVIECLNITFSQIIIIYITVVLHVHYSIIIVTSKTVVLSKFHVYILLKLKVEYVSC